MGGHTQMRRWAVWKPTLANQSTTFLLLPAHSTCTFQTEPASSPAPSITAPMFSYQHPRFQPLLAVTYGLGGAKPVFYHPARLSFQHLYPSTVQMTSEVCGCLDKGRLRQRMRLRVLVVPLQCCTDNATVMGLIPRENTKKGNVRYILNVLCTKVSVKCIHLNVCARV